MKIQFLVAAGAIAALAGGASAQALYSNAGGYGSNAIGLSTGNLTGSNVAAPAGFLWSECQNDGAGNANTSAGFTGSISGTGPTFRIADNFVVPAGQTWIVTSIQTFGYNTGTAPTFQPINGGTINIWNGAPNAGGTIVATGTFGSSANTNLYRIFSTTTPPPGSVQGTTRLVRQVTWNFSSVTLSAGTYWVDFQYTPTTAGASIFVPPITIPGTRGLAGWNALQLTAAPPAGWVVALDTGNPATAPDVPQDFPFIINGTRPPSCRPDLNNDGELTFDDIQLFVQLYNANDPRADFNNDQEWTFDDIQAFIALYNAGC
jgi:hypothetical protein